MKTAYQAPETEWLTVEYRRYLLASNDNVYDDDDPFNQ